MKVSENRWKKGFLIFLVVVECIILLEISLRVLFKYTQRGPDIKNLIAGEYDDNEYFQFNLRYRPHPYIGFEPNPRFIDLHGNKIHNSFGYRGREFPFKKPSGTFRIVCFGGSSTYDTPIWDNEKTYPRQLEKYLSRMDNNKHFRFEVINAGVGGYTSLEVFLNLVLKASLTHADLYVFYMGFNDIYPHIRQNLDYQMLKYRIPFSYIAIGKVNFYLMKYSFLYRTIFKKIFFPSHYKGIPWGIFRLTTKFPWPSSEEARKNFLSNKGNMFKLNLQRITRYIVEPKQILFVGQANGLTPQESVEYPWRTREYPEYMDFMRNLVEQHAKINNTFYYDLNREMKNLDKEEYFLDLIHTNEKGSELRAKFIGNFVLKNIVHAVKNEK